MFRQVGAAVLVLAAAGCATPYSGPPVPRVEYHQHLLSPAGVALVNRPPAPEVAVADAIARVLARRAEHWNDAAALRPLYTDDAIMLGFDAPGWTEGAAAASAYVGGRFGRPYQLTPIAVRDFGNVVEVAGYYSRGTQAERQLIGYFSMTLRREADGVWRIASETPVFPGPQTQAGLDAATLIAMLDAARIERAVILSDAYYFDAPHHRQPGYLDRVRAENDWTAAQAALHPSRLIAFCSFSPLEDYAINELQRCAARGGFRGVKLHFDSSEINLTNPDHTAKVRAVYAEANRLGLAIIAHLSTGPEYGRTQAEIFVREILPAVPDVPVVVAHLWGGGALTHSRPSQTLLAKGAPKTSTSNSRKLRLLPAIRARRSNRSSARCAG